MQKWFPTFNPLTLKAMNTPIWVRLPNLPLHFYTPDFLSLISNTLGRFIKTDTDRISKGFFTYARICVKIDLSQGLPDKIFFKRAGKDPYLQLIDYENTAFRCRSCQQKGHLQDSCPVFPFTPSSFGPRKKASRWQDPKSRNYHATPYAEAINCTKNPVSLSHLLLLHILRLLRRNLLGIPPLSPRSLFSIRKLQ